jgi:hypothetical protein
MKNQFAKWDTAYINDLPDAAFAIIEPAYSRGETQDKNCRHLPHHTEGVKDGSDSSDNIDMDHLRNAWQRRNQIKPVTDSISQDELRAKAERHLTKHINDLKLDWSSQSMIELIPDQFSLSLNGFARIRLIASLQSVSAQPPVASASSNPLPASDAEFYRVRFRALSQIYIEDYCLDMTKPGMLEKSASLLKNQTVYTDHRVSVQNWIGVVENSFWDGASNPPGIDADLKIDIKENPKIVRGLSIQPPAIHSCSVQYFCLWSKSHPDLNIDEFLDRLGTEFNGQIVRFIIDEITNYGELSLVWRGADPNAKRKLQSRLNSEFRIPHSEPQNFNQGGQVDEKQIKELQANFEALQKEKGDLTTKIASLEKDATLGRQYADELRQKAESLYRLTKGDSANQAFIDAMIKTAPLENVKVLMAEYETQLNDSFVCPHCQKKITGLRASIETPAPTPDQPSDTEAKNYKV